VPALQAFLSHLDSVREKLVRDALGGARAADERVEIASGLLAFPVWRAMRDAGVGEVRAAEALRRAVGCAVTG
jgi:hypothetical protein